MPAKRAFTLVELLLVVILLALLAALAVPRFAQSGGDSKANACRMNTAILNSQIEIWASAHGGQYPADQAEFEANVATSADVFPDGPPACPYGLPYVYDPARRRVTPHRHAASRAEVIDSQAQPLGTTP